MTTAFKNVLNSGLGSSPTTVLTTNASARTTVIGLSLTNTTSGIILASVQLQDTVASTTAYFVNNIVIPPNTSARVINGGERLVCGPSTNIIVNSNFDNSIDLVMSYVEIS
jgi:hypothetical protein